MLKTTFLLLLNLSVIIFLGYVAQSGLLSSFVFVAFIFFTLVAIPFLAAHAIKLYLNLFIKQSI